MRLSLVLVCATGALLPGAVFCAELEAAAQMVATRADDFRRSEGRAALAPDAALERAAADFARFMAKNGQLSHEADGRDPVARAKAAGYDHCIVAENIAMQYRSDDFTSEALARELVEGWKRSPGHRRNLLDGELTQTGVGVARSAQGRYYAVQLFGRPRSAAVRFSVRNPSSAEVQYRIGERNFRLQPRAERKHLECRKPVLQLPGRREGLLPGDGSVWTIGE